MNFLSLLLIINYFTDLQEDFSHILSLISPLHPSIHQHQSKLLALNANGAPLL